MKPHTIILTIFFSCMWGDWASAEDIDVNPHYDYSAPRSEFDRQLSNPTPPAPSQGIPTEVDQGNYYGGLGTGANTVDQHGQPDPGYGGHVGRRW